VKHRAVNHPVFLVCLHVAAFCLHIYIFTSFGIIFKPLWKSPGTSYQGMKKFIQSLWFMCGICEHTVVFNL
jgi:hypothetical protein